MKRKLLLAAVTLFAAVFSGGNSLKAQSYTVSDLESDGWAAVTNLSSLTLSENYFIFVDADASATAMFRVANSDSRPQYNSLVNPVTNINEVWVLEANGDKFNIKGNDGGYYFNSGNAGWNDYMGHNNDNGKFSITLNNGKYSIVASDYNNANNYVGPWNNDGHVSATLPENVACNKSAGQAPGFFIYSIARSEFEAQLAVARNGDVATATKTAPANVTSYIINPDFAPKNAIGWTRTGSAGNQQWGQQTMESWNNSNMRMSQTLVGLPNGRYKVTVDMISGNDVKTGYLFASSKNDVESEKVSAKSSADNYTTMSNEVAGKILTADNVDVVNNTMTIGVADPSGWIVIDNFTISCYGLNLAGTAIALPSDGAMVADTWYYFDIDVAANNYNATADALGYIVYTTAGETLMEDIEGLSTSKLNSEGNSFEATRYYVKSSSANHLVVAPASYTYVVGEATVDKSYIQPGNIVTVSYTGLVTSDPNPNLTRDFSGVTFNEEAITPTLTANGFSFVIPEGLTAGASYTLAIPAGAIGYEAGETFNAAQDITLKTPAVFDGVYYMYNTYTKTYISRAGNYNTQAILDTWGLAFNVSTDAENNTQLQYFDSQFWLGDDGWCYGDCTGNRVRSFNVTAVEGGYKFLNTNNRKYLAANNGAAIGDAVEGDNLVGTSNVWALESTADHVANYTRNADAQASAAATAAGLSGITTKAALDEELSTNYSATSITITGSKAEKFEQYPGNSLDSGPLTYYSETVNNLKPGLYKLSVDAFQRAAGNERVAAADGARSLIYLYAGDVKTQLMSVMDYGATTAYSVDFSYNGKHYPDNQASAYVALETGNYANDVYVYVADAGEGVGSLEIGIKNPTRLGGSFATWAVYNNWILTRFDAKATTAEKEALADAITVAEDQTLGFETGEYAPYNNVEAVTALAAAQAIVPETASSEAVVAATAALTNATWTVNTEEVNAFYDGSFNIQDEHTTGPTALAGWNNPEGIRQLIKNTETNPGLNSATGNAAVFAWGNTTVVYGNTVGYTMPLAAHTLYELSFKTCGWSDGDMGYVNVTVLNSANKGLSQKQSVTATKRVNEENPWNESKYVFMTDEAGDYTFGMWTSKHTVFTDLVLKKATSVTIDETTAYDNTLAATIDVTLNRTIRVGANTLVLPFSMTQEEVEDNFGKGAKVYVISEYDDADDATPTIRFAEQKEGIMPNKPCILEATVAGTSYTLAGRTLVASESDPKMTTTDGDFSMIGTYAPIEEIGKNANNYIMYGDDLYFVDSKVSMDGTRAYFHVNGSNNSRVLSVVYEGDEATEIAEIDEEPVEDGVIYNLAGQVVGPDYKGIAIINGKKVLLK